MSVTQSASRPFPLKEPLRDAGNTVNRFSSESLNESFVLNKCPVVKWLMEYLLEFGCCGSPIIEFIEDRYIKELMPFQNCKLPKLLSCSIELPLEFCMSTIFY